MRTAALLGVVASLWATLAVAEQPADRAAVLAAIGRWDTAWATKDHELGAQDYADDAHWVNAFGMERSGRAAISDTLKEVFALPFVMSGQSEPMVDSVRFLDDDAAVVESKVERRGQSASSGEALGVRRTSHLRVFQKRSGQWLIVSHLISDARDRERPAH